MENRLDPVRVREARELAAAALANERHGFCSLTAGTLSLLIRALDEGREASAPFVSEMPNSPLTPNATPISGFLHLRDDPSSLTFGDLRRLAAFNALFEENNDGR